MRLLAAGHGTIGNPVANIAIFAIFVLFTLYVVIRASRRNATATEFFTADRAFSGPQNGIAIAGDYLSAASFLGIAGAIAVYGYDGFLYSIGFLVAWLVALLLVAELLRNTGKFTMADVLSFRLRQRPVRLAAAASTLTVSLFYLLAQMAGAGGLVALLLNVKGRLGESIVIAVVGVLMIVYVLIGGMKGTTWVQIIKAVLLILGAAAMTVMVLAKFGMNSPTSWGRRSRRCRTPQPRASPAVTCWPRARNTVDRRPRRSTYCRWPLRWCSAPRACPTC
jgi:cation/acetate symporter